MIRTLIVLAVLVLTAFSLSVRVLDLPTPAPALFFSSCEHNSDLACP